MPIFEGSFDSKALRDFYYEGAINKIPIKNISKLKNILDYLNTIDKLPPSPMLFRAHEHKGKGKGTWSFDISSNRRVLCEFDEDLDSIHIRIEGPH